MCRGTPVENHCIKAFVVEKLRITDSFRKKMDQFSPSRKYFQKFKEEKIYAFPNFFGAKERRSLLESSSNGRSSLVAILDVSLLGARVL